MRRFACLMTSFSGGPVWSYWAPHFQPRDLMRPQGRWRPFQRRHFAPNIHLWPLWTSSKSSLSWINKMSNHAPVTVWHTWAQTRFAAGFLDVFGWEEYEKLKKKYIKHTCTHCTLKRRTVYSNLTVQQPLQLSVLPAWNPPSQSSLHSIVFVQNISTSSFSWFKFRLESCIILKINVRVLAHKLSTNGRWWWCYAEAEQQLANKMSGRVRRKQLPQHVVIKEAATPVCVRDDRWPTLSLWQQGGTFLLTNCWRDTSEFSSLWHRVAPRIQSVFVCLLIVQR